jgi:hypothetical protein
VNRLSEFAVQSVQPVLVKIFESIAKITIMM